MKHFHYSITNLRGRFGRRYAFIAIPLAASLLFSLTACQKSAPPVDALREVVVLPVQADATVQSVALPAEVQARFVTPMSFRIGGQVVERLVHLGDSVKKGQVVARLDPIDANHNTDSAQADLASAQQHFDAADKQFQRDTQQAKENLISALQFEQTQDTYAAAKSQLKSAEARAAVAGNQSGYTRLIAEHDGVITAEPANTGEVLAAGQPVYSLAWSGAMDVMADASESQVAKLHAGQSAAITLTAMPGAALSGQVREISPAADPQSRTFRVKVTLNSHDPALRLGMSGEVAIRPDATGKDPIATNAQATIIPATALFHQANQAAVWVVKPGDARLELRTVTVGVYRERSVSLINGVVAGEKIVVQGVHTLTSGETVKPIPPLHSEDFAL